MRRRVLFSITNPSSSLVAYYPLNGDLNDYSGNNNHITEYTGVAIGLDHISSSQTGFCVLPFYLGSSINTTVSISFYYSSQRTITSNIWGRVGDISSSWTKRSNVITLYKTGAANLISCCTDGETIGTNTDIPFIINAVNNITWVKTDSVVNYYINGNLYRTNSVVADNYHYGSSYKPYLGNRNNVGGLLTSEGGNADIYGFAYFKKALTASEVKKWSEALNSGTLIS